MVRIINYLKKTKKDGTIFYVLELQGGIRMVYNKETNQYYATANKAFINTTFEEETCKALLGTEIPGTIVKQAVEPYSYTIKSTGEKITLSYKWVFVPKEEQENHDKALGKLMADTTIFSQNGVSKPAS